MTDTGQSWTIDRRASKMEGFYFFTLAKGAGYIVHELANDLEHDWDGYPYLGYSVGSQEITRYRRILELTHTYEEVIEFLKLKIRNELN